MSKLPMVTLKWAQTLDGQLADDLDQSQWISGSEERKYTHKVRARHEAVLVGAQTFLKDRCQLTVRDAELSGPQPARVIMDPRGRVLEMASRRGPFLEALESGPRRTYLLTDVLDSDDGMAEWPGSNVVKVPYRFDNFENWLSGSICQLVKMFELYEDRPLKNLMVEGGASTLAAFLSAGLVNRIEVAISPLILGGQKHHVATRRLLSQVDRFEVESQQQFGSDILLRYKISSRGEALRRTV